MLLPLLIQGEGNSIWQTFIEHLLGARLGQRRWARLWVDGPTFPTQLLFWRPAEGEVPGVDTGLANLDLRGKEKRGLHRQPKHS